MVAAMENHYDTVRLLASSGANLEAKNLVGVGLFLVPGAVLS